MDNPLQIEDSILRAIEKAGPDRWLDVSLMGDLRNRLLEISKPAASASLSILWEAILCLAGEGLVLVQKRDVGLGPVPFNMQRRNDQGYQNTFFNQGQFQLKLTHEGRRRLSGASAESQQPHHEFDDGMVQLYRKKHFRPDLEAAVTAAHDQDEPLAVLMVDIDKFASFNNTHGHLVGDEVLKGIGELVHKRIRGKGKAYRYGGDEITVTLPNFSSSEAVALAEELRRSVEAARIGNLNLNATVSIGVACLPEHAEDAQTLFDGADKAAYSAKEMGRNLVRVSGEPEDIVPPHQREIKRREPSDSGLTEAEAEYIRGTYFRERRMPACPRDGCALHTEEVREAGFRGTTLIVNCPECGLAEILTPAT